MSTLSQLAERLKEEKYQNVDSLEFQSDLKRLLAGEPYEYVYGSTSFLEAKIDLSYRPMIPRLETAFWVEQAITELKNKPGTLRLADTFAGAGNVACAVLLALPNSTMDISELDENLKPQIEKNIKLNGISEERVNIKSASALDGLNGLYDGIFAVPPYVPYDALPELDLAMREYEPHLAFFAEDDGHFFIDLLIKQAMDFLKPGGSLYFEADFDDGEYITSLVAKSDWKQLDFKPDPYGYSPNVFLRKA